MFWQRSSANINEREFLNNIKNKHKGRAVIKVIKRPEEITPKTCFVLFSALCFVINLETVIGVPEQHIVSNSAKTERATW